MSVLIEDKGYGHTKNFLKVKINEVKSVNQLIDVKLTKNCDDYLVGKII